MKELEIDLVQAALRPGDSLVGVVRTEGPGDRLVHLSLQGEEILSANSIAFNYVLPFFESSLTLDCSQGPADFHFLLPETAPPTYFSQDLRCLYVLKGRRKGAAAGLLPGLRRDAIKKIDIPVLSAPVDANLEQHWFVLEGDGTELEVRLDSTHVEPGQSFTGELMLRRRKPGPLPKNLTFRFAAIEESTKSGYYHRKVTSLQTRDIVPEEEFEYPLQGFFEFHVPSDAAASGQWNMFRVHYGFRVGMTLANGEQVRKSLPIIVCRYPQATSEFEILTKD